MGWNSYFWAEIVLHLAQLHAKVYHVRELYANRLNGVWKVASSICYICMYEYVNITTKVDNATIADRSLTILLLTQLHIIVWNVWKLDQNPFMIHPKLIRLEELFLAQLHTVVNQNEIHSLVLGSWAQKIFINITTNDHNPAKIDRSRKSCVRAWSKFHTQD